MKVFDQWGDHAEVFHTEDGDVQVWARETNGGTTGVADLLFTPKRARKLAKKLKKAAKQAEQIS